MWIPEVTLGNHTFMEPIMEVANIPKPRWKLVSDGRVRMSMRVLTTSRTAISANSVWVLAYNVATRIAIKRFTLLVQERQSSSLR